MTNAFRALIPVFALACVLSVPTDTMAQSLPEPITKMSDAAENAPASKSSTDISFTVTESGTKTFQGKVSGTSITEEGENPDAEGSFSITVEDLRNAYFKSLFGTKKLSIGLDFKVLPSTESLYFRVYKFPKFAGFNTTKFAKKWVYVDVGDYASEYASKADLSSREVLEHFADAYKKYPAITFTEQGSTSNEYVYTFRANSTMLMRMVNEAYRLAGEDEVFSSYEVSDVGSRLENVTGTLKIDRQSYLPTASTYKFSFRHDEYRASVTGATTYKYGNVKAVKKPSGAISIERWYQGLFGDLEDARSKGSDAAAKSNLANARAEAELYYDDNGYTYDGVCSSRGTWGILDNVDAAADATGKGKGTCNDSDLYWAASVKLSTGKYYCVDSTGYAKETSRKLGTNLSCS